MGPNAILTRVQSMNILRSGLLTPVPPTPFGNAPSGSKLKDTRCIWTLLFFLLFTTF